MVAENGGGAPRRPTLYDVARRVGVSHQTVSRVVKGHTNVRPEMRERIEAAIAELGYKPNLMARSLATAKPHRIGAIVYELLQSGPSKIVEGASERAREAGYVFDIVTLDPRNDGGIAEAIAQINQTELAGILAFTPTDAVIRALRSASFSVPVSFESEATEWAGEGESAMGEAGVAEIVGHLASLGHRTLFHIAGPDGWLAARGRARAYRAAVEAWGLESAGVVPGDWSARSGYDAIRSMPADAGVTAIVAANDQTALGAIAALDDRGISVPHQMSVVGFDDIPESQFFRPPLTTVHFDFTRQGRIAVEHLLSAIEGSEPGPGPEAVPPTIVVRASTAPPPVSRGAADRRAR